MTNKQEKEVNRIIKETRESAFRYYYDYYKMDKAQAANCADRTVEGIRFDVANQVLKLPFPATHRSQWCRLYPHC